MPEDDKRSNQSNVSRRTRLWTWWADLWREFDSLDNERLSEALDEFASLRSKRRPDEVEAWYETAEKLEQQARAHKEAGERNAAWSALKAADRELIWDFSLEELRLEVERVAFESKSKLSGWRAKTVSAVLSPECGRLTDADELSELRHRVFVSRRILDEALDNVHRKNDMLRIQVGRSALSATVLLAVASIVLALQVRAGWSPSEIGYLLGDLQSFAVVLVLGAVGASLSGLLTLARTNGASRAPDLRLRWIFLKYRPVIGAISAIVVVAILQSGVAGLSVTSEAALVASIVAGFSERLVTRSLDTAATNLGG